jgi:small subunit ribosomal protein S15
MNQLVHQRASLLKYLRRKSVSRYEALLPRLGIMPRAVEGEVIVLGKPRMKIAA